MKNLLIIAIVFCSVLMSLSCGNSIKERKSPESKRLTVSSLGQPPDISIIKQHDLKFWDNMDFNVYQSPESRGKAVDEWKKLPTKNRPHAAYRFGVCLASDNHFKHQQLKQLAKMVDESIDSEELVATNNESFLQNTIVKVRNEGEYCLSALILSGFYLGYLNNVMESEDPNTNLPNSFVINEAVQKLPNLKEYINQSLISEKDIRTVILIQKVQSTTDSLLNVYNNIPRESDKYSKMKTIIKNIDNYF